MSVAVDAAVNVPDLLAAHYDIVYFPLGAASYGGAERSLLELASAQARNGARVLVCHEAALAGTGFIDDARVQGLPVLQVAWSPAAGPLGVWRAAWRLFGQLQAGIVQFNISWRPHMWLVPVAARLAGRARLLGTMRAMPEPVADLPPRRYFGLFDGPPLRHLMELVLGRVWARALHRTVSVNRDDYPPRLVAEYGFPRERLRVIHNGVRLKAEAPTPAERSAARAALGLPEGRFALACVGRVSPEKGIAYAIEALALCDPSVDFHIVGEGPEVPSLQALAARLGLQARVRFHGYLADPLPLFSAADAVVVPSLWNEAFGRVVVEAMGCGTPVIATAVGGMRELFDDGREGFFVPKADAPAIAHAVDRWVADRAQWATMAAAARRLAVERYSTTRVAAEYAVLYAELQRDARP